jgi:hypothetical protein
MNQNQTLQSGRGCPEGIEPRVVEFGSVNGSGDLDPAHLQIGNGILEFGGRLLGSLQWNRAQRYEPIRPSRGDATEALVEHSCVMSTRRWVESVRSEIDPARNQLDVDTRPVHCRQTIIYAGESVPQRLSGDSSCNQCATPPFFLDNLDTVPASVPLQTFQHGGWYAVSVDVDGHRSTPES